MEKVRTLNSIGKILFATAIFTLALSVGYLHGRHLALPDTKITLTPDTRQKEATVQLMGIRNGQLQANVHGNVRFFVGDKQVFQTGSVAVAAGPMLKNEIEIRVPPWARYVASSRGSKFYPVDSSGGERIVPQNRLYFRSEEEARGAGYRE